MCGLFLDLQIFPFYLIKPSHPASASLMTGTTTNPATSTAPNTMNSTNISSVGSLKFQQ